MPGRGIFPAGDAVLLPQLGRIRVRPLAVDDRPAYCAFAARLAREDMRLRFGAPVRLDDPALRDRMLAIDHNQVEVLAAFDEADALLGVGRLARTAPATAEIALIVRSDLKRHGLGRLLLGELARQACRAGIRVLIGQVLHENYPMLRLAASVGARAVAFCGFFVELRFDLAASCDYDL